MSKQVITYHDDLPILGEYVAILKIHGKEVCQQLFYGEGYPVCIDFQWMTDNQNLTDNDIQVMVPYWSGHGILKIHAVQ